MLDINIIMALNILFSQYFNVSRSKVICAFLRLYCIFSLLYATFHSSVYISYLYYNDPKGLSYILFITIQYIFWCFVSQTSCENYISTYTSAILSCDHFMGYAKLVIQIKYMFTLTIICIFLSTLSLFFDAFVSKFWTARLAETGYTVLILLSQWFITTSLELPVLRLFVVVGLLQNRLMKLRRTLEDGITVSEDIVSRTDTESKVKIVRKCIITYKNLLDAFDNVFGHLHRIMFVVLLFTVPEFVMFGYSLIKQVVFKDFLRRIFIVDALRCCIKITSPCIVCDLCHNEVDQLKMLLLKHITQCLDGDLRAELLRALEYVTRRPFSFSLLRAVRINVQLPVTICALSLTYIILVIEFSHFVL